MVLIVRSFQFEFRSVSKLCPMILMRLGTQGVAVSGSPISGKSCIFQISNLRTDTSGNAVMTQILIRFVGEQQASSVMLPLLFIDVASKCHEGNPTLYYRASPATCYAEPAKGLQGHPHPFLHYRDSCKTGVVTCEDKKTISIKQDPPTTESSGRHETTRAMQPARKELLYSLALFLGGHFFLLLYDMIAAQYIL